MDRTLRFGWFIPTAGDTTRLADMAETPPSMELFERVARAAEQAGFEYALVPVQTACWEAWISCAMISARTERLTMLVAARPGLIAPTVTAKMSPPSISSAAVGSPSTSSPAADLGEPLRALDEPTDVAH